MPKKYSKQISLRLDDNIYSSLLIEADGDPRQIPDVIRKKLTDAYLSRDDARILRTQQELILRLLKELMLDNIPTVVRMKGILAGYDDEKRKLELDSIETLATQKLELLERLKRENGL
jgi:hypothetical protein